MIAVTMVMFSLLGSTMGFSVESFGFYPLFLPLMAILGYDRMTTAAMIILGCLTGVLASTVNPFSIGVASNEADVSIGDGIALRVGLWVALTTMSIFWVIRYAERIKADPSKSLTGFNDNDDLPNVPQHQERVPERLTRTQKAVLVIMAATFALLIFAVVPWSSILGPITGPAEYDQYHTVSTEPYA